jgi:hypothetical protein
MGAFYPLARNDKAKPRFFAGKNYTNAPKD